MLDNREWAIIRELMPLDDPAHPFIGDDCALWREKGLVVTTDHMAEGVHFDISFMPPDAVGWRLMAANASDILAMGSRPTHFTLNLALPADRQETARGIIAGIVRFAKTYGLVCLGGDTTGATAFFIGATMFGTPPVKPLLRSGARPGDRIYLAGDPGLSKAGLLRLQRGMNDDNAAKQRFLYPDPFAHAPLTGTPNAAIDLSDSLVSELTLLANASDVSMEISVERLPLHPMVAQTAHELGIPLTDLLLTGGEEFFLIVTASGAMPGWHEIGLVTQRRTDALTIRDNGRLLDPALLPVWDHFGR